MFQSRLELISYVIQQITNASKKECDEMAIGFETKPFIIRITCDYTLERR
jgi:hypothetical protein